MTKKGNKKKSQEDQIKWLAVGSIMAVVADLVFGFGLSFIAMILGYIALAKIKKHGFEQYKILALIGFFIGLISTILLVVTMAGIAESVF